VIANVVHTSLNAGGGSERLAVATVRAIASMEIDVDLSTLENPDKQMMHNAYGSNPETDIKRIRTLNILRKYRPHEYNLTVNTHGDMLPFYQKDFTRTNAVTYCHYPIAVYYIDIGDPDYLTLLQNICPSGMAPAVRNEYYNEARTLYIKMMLSSTILTNSDFSRRAIFKTFGVDSTVLPPPVDVDTFRKACAASNARDDSILVISRFHPSKKIENAIHLAKLLHQNGLGTCMNIVGNMPSDGIGYFNYLNYLVKRYDLEDFIKFDTNLEFSMLLELMGRSKVYFHPLPGEPFGISTVEAMSAGIIPVVPDIGGHTEFVPEKYHFHTFGQGVDAVATALGAKASERMELSYLTQRFSTANYIKNFQQILVEATDMGKNQLPSKPVLSSSSSASAKSLAGSMSA